MSLNFKVTWEREREREEQINFYNVSTLESVRERSMNPNKQTNKFL